MGLNRLFVFVMLTTKVMLKKAQLVLQMERCSTGVIKAKLKPKKGSSSHSLEWAIKTLARSMEINEPLRQEGQKLRKFVALQH